jgi:hypothetical protein
MAWTNVVTELLRALLCDGKCLSIVAELWINCRTACCANLSFNCETLRSARGASRNLVSWSLRLDHVNCALWRVMARSYVIVEFFGSLHSNRETFDVG